MQNKAGLESFWTVWMTVTSMDVVESGAAVRVVSGGGGSSSGVVAAAGLVPVGIDDDDEQSRLFS